jgi:hypothetical protein
METEQEQKTSIANESVIDLNKQTMTRPVDKKPEVLSQALTAQDALADTCFSTLVGPGFSTLEGPGMPITTGAPAQPTSPASPANTDKPVEGEKATIIEDGWTKRWYDNARKFLHIGVLDFKIIPENAQLMSWVPNGENLQKNGMTFGEAIRSCLIPCLKVCDVLSGKIRENGYDSTLLWFTRAVDPTQEDQPKSSEHYLRDIARQLKLQTDINAK